MKTYENLKLWERPDNYAGETYFDYYWTGIGESRDSGCLERANFQAMLEKLGGESETVIVARAGHWAVGWVQSILIHKKDNKSLKIANETMKGFDNYPVIDDCKLSEVENDEIQNTIENYNDDFRKTVCEVLNVDFDTLSKQEKNEVDNFISHVMYEDQGYRGVEDAFVTEESIERGIESLKYHELDTNLAEFFQTAFNLGEK